MQKVIRFLEAGVQWIALVIAVGYLGWAAFAYLISDPVSVSLGGQQVNPATIDNFIDTHAAQVLRDKFDPNVQVPSFAVQPFGDDFNRRLALNDEKPMELATGVFAYQPFEPTGTLGQNAKLLNPVQSLPTLPAAHPVLVAAALNTLAPPAAPGAAPAGPAAVPVANPVPGKDVRLVVAAFTISWDELYKQWNSSFGPPVPGQQPRLSPADFQILQITAFRSEKIGDKWVDDDKTPIKILNGADLPAYPPAGNQVLENEYLQALNKTPSTLVAPAIPPVTAGAIWKDPVQYLPGASNEQGVPGQPDQNGAMLPPESGRLRTVNASEPLGTVDVQYRGGPPGGFGGPYGPPGGFRPPPMPVAPPAPQAPPPPTTVPPADGTVEPKTALVDPKLVLTPTPVEPVTRMNVVAMTPKSPDLFIYVIDESAQSGRTYRYSISYKALNPLFNKAPQRVTPAHQNWVNQFDLTAPVSSFSPEITVPTQTYFYCGKQQGINPGSRTPFDIFTWSNGKWQMATFMVDFGDPIGGLDGSVDYSTGCTYVYKQPVKNKTVFTLVDRQGNVEVRDASQDANSADYKQKTQWIEQQKAGTTAQPAAGIAGYPAYPGGPPGGPPVAPPAQ